MTKKFLKFFSNNFYFCLLYMFSTLLLITTFNDLFVVKILLKISLVWGISLSFYHIYKILKRNPNKIETAIFIFLILTLLLTLIFYRNTTNLKTWIINLILMTGVFYIDKDKPK
ncbi:MAG: polymerase, partial [Clostridium sp.]